MATSSEPRSSSFSASSVLGGLFLAWLVYTFVTYDSGWIKLSTADGETWYEVGSFDSGQRRVLRWMEKTITRDDVVTVAEHDRLARCQRALKTPGGLCIVEHHGESGFTVETPEPSGGGTSSIVLRSTVPAT